MQFHSDVPTTDATGRAPAVSNEHQTPAGRLKQPPLHATQQAAAATTERPEMGSISQPRTYRSAAQCAAEAAAAWPVVGSSFRGSCGLPPGVRRGPVLAAGAVLAAAACRLSPGVWCGGNAQRSTQHGRQPSVSRGRGRGQREGIPTLRDTWATTELGPRYLEKCQQTANKLPTNCQPMESYGHWSSESTSCVVSLVFDCSGHGKRRWGENAGI